MLRRPARRGARGRFGACSSRGSPIGAAHVVAAVEDLAEGDAAELRHGKESCGFHLDGQATLGPAQRHLCRRLAVRRRRSSRSCPTHRARRRAQSAARWRRLPPGWPPPRERAADSGRTSLRRAPRWSGTTRWPTAISRFSTPAPPQAMNLRQPRAITSSSRPRPAARLTRDERAPCVRLRSPFIDGMIAPFALAGRDARQPASLPQPLDHLLEEADDAALRRIDGLSRSLGSMMASRVGSNSRMGYRCRRSSYGFSPSATTNAPSRPCPAG